MKTGQYYQVRKNMARVAKPIIDVFLKGKSEEEKQKILRKLIAKTTIDPKLKGNKGYCLSRSKEIGLSEDATLETYGHEAVHFLSKYLNNHSITANAVDVYLVNLNNFGRDHEESRYGVISPKNLRPLTRLERFFSNVLEHDFVHFDLTGRSLGGLAARLEGETGIPGAGLYFIKAVDESSASFTSIYSLESRFKEKKVAGLREFSERYGSRLTDVGLKLANQEGRAA